MRRIPLRARDGSLRAEALVDDEDFERLGEFAWSMMGNGYVVRHARLGHRRYAKVLLHREILGLDFGDPLIGDHRNGDQLDNRRANLRVVTAAGNAQNRHGPDPRVGRTSRYRGVCWNRAARKWKAYAVLNDRMHNLGHFDTEGEAARVASAFRREHMPFSVMDQDGVAA